MKIKSIQIHNFRSILDSGVIELKDLSLLIGANNSGKSNIIDALRILYDEDKFDSKRDFPKSSLKPSDNESWLDVRYSLSEDEFRNLPDYAKNFSSELKIRKYFKSDDAEQCKSGQSNIFAYEKEGVIAKSLWHGAKNVSEAKLGKVIFIPSVSKSEEVLKISGPSPLRQIATFVLEKIAKKGTAFSGLESAVALFEKELERESSADEYSMKGFVDDINKHLEEWQISFGVGLKKIRVEDIIKNLFEHTFKDYHLGYESIDIDQYGQGFQRHVIYTLIRLSAKYVEKKAAKKKEFSPDYTFILFEEPEAFLHPAQQEILYSGLKALSIQQGEPTQILLSTHSPLFTSRSIDDLPSIIRLEKEGGKTQISQINDKDKDRLFGSNMALRAYLRDRQSDPKVPQPAKDEIGRLIDGRDDSIILDEESMQYFLWLSPERCSLFFADFVIICEGSSEKLFIEYLLKTQWDDLRKKRVYLLDAGGKYNIHRFMNLCHLLNIKHSVLMDSDSEKKHHVYIHNFIESVKNPRLKEIYKFDSKFEEFLGIPETPDKYKKPLNIFYHHRKNDIKPDKLEKLKGIICKIVE